MLVMEGSEDAQQSAIESFFAEGRAQTLLLHGDAGEVLGRLPQHSVDACLTSPPYWDQRRYDSGNGLGQEPTPDEYADHLCSIFRQLKRVLKPHGSLWLNLGDTYEKKRLCGVPWRAALRLGGDGWMLRNAIVWDKLKGNPCNAKDKLRNTYEMVFHLVLRDEYFYDVDAVRNTPGKPYYKNGRVVTPTGVSGEKYERQIRESTALSETERKAALLALQDALRKVETGDMPDFRMIIRGCQRSTHSDEPEYSGRAAELAKRGYCVLPYHAKGTKPGDVWRIIPEDEWRTDDHYAVFPIELCQLPIRTTCPKGGILLDPFVGTGSAVIAAVLEDRRGVGIDTSPKYLETARKRVQRATEEHRLRTSQRTLL